MVDTLNTKPPGTFDKATPPKATAKPIRFDLMKTPPIEIPVGITVSIFGVPYFIYLMMKEK